MLFSRDIQQIQEQLIAAVGEPPVADGKWGRRTQEAVERAERADYVLKLIKREHAAPLSRTVANDGAQRVLECAQKYLGLKEIKGRIHEPQILKFWDRIKLGGINDDETPWCAAFVGAVLEECGFKSTRSGRARSYSRWGVRCNYRDFVPLGALVVLARGKPGPGSGHIGILAKLYDGSIFSPDHTIHLLGGNQSNMVCYADYNADRLVDVRVHKEWLTRKLVA